MEKATKEKAKITYKWLMVKKKSWWRFEWSARVQVWELQKKDNTRNENNDFHLMGVGGGRRDFLGVGAWR